MVYRLLFLSLIYIFGLRSLLGQSSLAQNCGLPDSIEVKLKAKTLNERNKIKLHYYVEEIRKKRNMIHCLELGFAKENLTDSLAALYYLAKGRALHNLFLYQKALSSFSKADSFAKKANYISLSCNIANSKGISYIKNGEPPKAIQSFLEAQRLALDLRRPSQAALLNHNIALLYKEEGLLSEALERFLELEHKIEQGELNYSNRQRSLMLHNIAVTYFDLGKYDECLKFLEKAIEIKEKLNDIYNECISRIKYYQVLSKLGLREKATLAFEKVTLDLAKIYAPDLKGNMQKAWGDVLLDIGELNEAKLHLEIAFKISQDNNLLDNQFDCLGKLALIHEKQGNFKRAYELYKQQANVKDSLNLVVMASTVKTAETAHRLEMRELEIKSLEQKQRFQRYTIASTVALAITILLALFALYSRYRTKVQSNLELTDRNQEINRQYVLISQRNREIGQINAQLYHKQQELEAQNHLIARRNKELKQANETLEQFGYAASHDLTPPLRTTRNFLSLIEAHSPEFSQTVQEYLRYAKSGTDKLVLLLRALLAYNRVGRQQTELDHIDLNKVLAQVHLHLASEFERIGGIMEINSLPEVSGIRAETFEVFEQLVKNALRFRHPDRRAEIHVYATQDQTNHYIHVQDNGIGIRKNDQDQVFSILRKLNGDQYEGEGIGLAICQRIMRSIGGEISVQSVFDEGTTFIIQWPQVVEHKIHEPEAISQ